MCTLHLQQSQFRPAPFSGSEQPHVAGGYCAQKCSLGRGVNRLTYILGFKSQSKRKQEKKDNRQTTHTHMKQKKNHVLGEGEQTNRAVFK